jgi:hypothetical protein
MINKIAATKLLFISLFDCKPFAKCGPSLLKIDLFVPSQPFVCSFPDVDLILMDLKQTPVSCLFFPYVSTK